MNIFNRITNRSLDYLLFNRWMEPYWLDRMRGKIMCLLYHRIDDPDNNSFLTHGGSPVIQPEEFEKDLSFYLEHGVRFMSFSDIRKNNFPSVSEIGIIVSFDDCFLVNYTNGLKILDKLGIKAVFFQTTALIDAQELIWEHALYWYAKHSGITNLFVNFARNELAGYKELSNYDGLNYILYIRKHVAAEHIEALLLKAKDYFGMTREMDETASRIYPRSKDLKKAFSTGHEIGSHGHNHYNRKNIKQSLFVDEILQSQAAIEKVTGIKPLCFSYPFGSYFENDRVIVEQYFKQAAIVHNNFITRSTDPFLLPRYTWPGNQNSIRRRRWLLSGSV